MNRKQLVPEIRLLQHKQKHIVAAESAPAFFYGS